SLVYLPTATSEIYTLSLHDALPISIVKGRSFGIVSFHRHVPRRHVADTDYSQITNLALGDKPLYIFVIPRIPVEKVDRNEAVTRSEEHTSELQSRENLVCRLLLEKK